jgi:formiminotetrahydrofolate cyclodeaminase
MSTLEIPNFLQLPTQTLLDEFGAGRHKPGSGSAAALLGLVACKMMQTVVTVTRRSPQYSASQAQLEFVGSILTQRHEPFFRDAVQRDSVQFDRYHQAVLARNACNDPAEKRRLNDRAREELIPATEIPLEIAQHGLDTAERGMIVFDLGARHARGDSGVAVSAALSSCSGALFIVYLNLLRLREGRWATTVRGTADSIAERFQALQFEQFSRVSRIQQEGVATPQLEFELPLQMPDDDEMA